MNILTESFYNQIKNNKNELLLHWEKWCSVDFFDKFDVNKLDSYIKKYITLIENETKDVKKRDKESYHHFELTQNEKDKAKKLIVTKITKYLERLDSTKNLERDILDIFNEFIIFSKYDFFHTIFFRVVNHFFKKKNPNI